MKDLTSKGMNWFEGIIPEVNDNMFQGTFRYVENRVNNVGGTLKKLCSDVVQDFLPLSADPIKCEAEELVPEGGAASSTFTKNDLAISIENFFSDTVVKESPLVIEAIDQDVDLSKNEKSRDTHEASESAFWRINELTTEDSALSNDPNTVEESVDGSQEPSSYGVAEFIEESSLDEFIGNNHDNSDQFKTVETSGSGFVVPALTKRNSDYIIDEYAIKESADDSELTFPSVTESIVASLIDESIETNNEKDCVAFTADAVALVEKQQLDHGYAFAEHHISDHFSNAKSMHTDAKSTRTNETSDSVLASVEFNSLTRENSDLNNDVNSIKESVDGELELTSPDVTESSKASSVDCNHENECMFSVNVALPTSVQNPEDEQCSRALCDIIADDAVCYFSTSSAPSEIAFSVVSEDTVTGTGLVSSASSSLRNSTGLPGCSSDILFSEANFCCVSETSSGFFSSTPTSAVSINEEALRQQLISSCTLMPFESTDGSHAEVTDLCMETIDLCDEMKLAESCVLVDDSTLHAISRRTQKLESYTKKIQNMFAVKKRLAKEYEQLAIWFGDAEINSSQDSSSDLHNQQTRHARESGWELL